MTAPDEVAGAEDLEKKLRTVRTKKDSRVVSSYVHARTQQQDQATEKIKSKRQQRVRVRARKNGRKKEGR